MSQDDAEADEQDVGLGRIGHLAAVLMGELEEAVAGEEGATPTVGEVAVVVELDWPEADEEPGASRVLVRCSNPRGWVVRGLLEEGIAGTHIEEDSAANEDDDE